MLFGGLTYIQFQCRGGCWQNRYPFGCAIDPRLLSHKTSLQFGHDANGIFTAAHPVNRDIPLNIDRDRLHRIKIFTDQQVVRRYCSTAHSDAPRLSAVASDRSALSSERPYGPAGQPHRSYDRFAAVVAPPSPAESTAA